MKRTFISTLIMFIIVASSFIIPTPKKKDKAGITIVELFTSQGCSSCPAADKVLDSLQNEYDENVFFLAYHVDYWNEYGWEDPYSRAEYSKYQREYANLLNVEVYTPMMVINGKDAFVGSKKDLANKKIDESIAASTNGYDLESIYENQAYFIKYNPSFNINSTRITVAYIKKEGYTKIKSGELGGKTLKYTNIVQRIEKVDCNKEGLSIVVLPVPPEDNNFYLVAFLQDKYSNKILGATRFDF